MSIDIAFQDIIVRWDDEPVELCLFTNHFNTNILVKSFGELIYRVF